MKRLIVVAAGTVALMSGAAYAGGCAYSDHAAKQVESSPVLSAVDKADALRQEKLKALEEQAALDSGVVVHN